MTETKYYTSALLLNQINEHDNIHTRIEYIQIDKTKVGHLTMFGRRRRRWTKTADITGYS